MRTRKQVERDSIQRLLWVMECQMYVLCHVRHVKAARPGLNPNNLSRHRLAPPSNPISGINGPPAPCPKWQYIGHKHNVSRNRENVAGSVFCNNAYRKLIQNASAVFQNVLPLPDCVRHGPKWQYIGHKNNGSRKDRKSTRLNSSHLE